jgi:hypothetical protein
MFKLFTIIITILVANCFIVIAKSGFVNQIPNGSKFSCNTCHTPGNTSSFNKFGQEIKKSYISGGKVNWVAALASLDSDGDGATNGVELLDPTGIWKAGNTNPGNSSDVTNPGDASSKPTSIFENENNQFSRELNFISVYPNPVISSAMINYELKYSGFITISLYDFYGNEVKSLFNGFIYSGIQNFVFDFNSFQENSISKGSYVIAIQSGSNTVIEKIVIQ